MIEHSYTYDSFFKDIFGHTKEETCTFIENDNVDDLTKEIIKNSFLSSEMLVLHIYYNYILSDAKSKLCKKLEEKFPQATFDYEDGDGESFSIIATIKPYKNLTEKRIEKICEMTNTTTDYDGEGQTVYFEFDEEGFFDKKYNIFSNFKTMNEIAIKYGLEELIIE